MKKIKSFAIAGLVLSMPFIVFILIGLFMGRIISKAIWGFSIF